MNSGIYVIRNKITGKVYVGSTKDFDKRKEQHFKNLEAGKHSSVKLQRSYIKHGKDNFEFEIIEEYEYIESIMEREQYWIDTLNSKVNGYNIADASFGDILTNHPDREEIIAKRTKTVLENNSKLTEEELSKKFGKFGSKNGRWNPERHLLCEKCGDEVSYTIAYRRAKLNNFENITCGKCRDRNGDKNPFYGKTHSDNFKIKLSIKVKERFENEELREIASLRSKEKWKDPEYIEKMKNRIMPPRKPHSEETKKKISKGNKGKTISEETRKKLSEANKGKSPSKEARVKTSKTVSSKKWYNNGEKSIRITEGELVPDGFVPGRLPFSEDTIKKHKLKRSYTNGFISIRLNDGDEIPEGFYRKTKDGNN